MTHKELNQLILNATHEIQRSQRILYNIQTGHISDAEPTWAMQNDVSPEQQAYENAKPEPVIAKEPF